MPTVRYAYAMGNLGNFGAINAFQQVLDDPDWEVNIQAERSIPKIPQ